MGAADDETLGGVVLGLPVGITAVEVADPEEEEDPMAAVELPTVDQTLEVLGLASLEGPIELVGSTEDDGMEEVDGFGVWAEDEKPELEQLGPLQIVELEALDDGIP